VGNPQVLKVGTEIDNASLSSLASAYPASTASRVINNWSRTQKTREREGDSSEGSWKKQLLLKIN